MSCSIEEFILSFLLSFLFLTSVISLFSYIHTKYYVKFIVVSSNNGKLKIHTKSPLSLTKAIETVEKLEQNYYWRDTDVFILKFNKFFWHPWKIYNVGKYKSKYSR